MSNENNNNTGTIIGAAIIGGAIGAIAALLLAPKSGEELRTDVSTKLQKVGQSAKDLAIAVGSTTKEMAGSIGTHAKEAAVCTKEAISDAAHGVKSDFQARPSLRDEAAAAVEAVQEIAEEVVEK